MINISKQQCISALFRDCQDWISYSNVIDGIYMIKPTASNTSFPVYCRFFNNTGFTVIQNRISGSVDFYVSNISFYLTKFEAPK